MLNLANMITFYYNDELRSLEVEKVWWNKDHYLVEGTDLNSGEYRRFRYDKMEEVEEIADEDDDEVDTTPTFANSGYMYNFLVIKNGNTSLSLEEADYDSVRVVVREDNMVIHDTWISTPNELLTELQEFLNNDH